MDSRTLTYIVAAVIVVALIALAVIAITTRQRRQHLRERFGSEYDQAFTTRGDERLAEAELEAREERVRQLHIRPLESAEQERFAAAWRGVQARFVDEPREAVMQADELIAEVMGARGYPMGDFEQRASDVSVNHADVVSNYRAAHDIARRSKAGNADTEGLRQAMVHYRRLFTDLLEQQTEHREEVRSDEPAKRTGTF